MNVGVMGGGQLGRMLALAGYPLGLRFRFLDPCAESPVAPLGDLFVGDFSDRATLEKFCRGLDVVTYEFESVPVEAIRWLAERVPVYPPPNALEIAQDRLLEKTLFQTLGIPTPQFAPIDSEADLRQAVAKLAWPTVLKTRRFGYDGKGQRVLRKGEDIAAAWNDLGNAPLILEQFVPFDREASLLAVRNRSHETRFYPLVENRHRDGILRLSLAPASGISPSIQTAAEDFASRILAAVDYVGVLAVEFFLKDGELLANEMAPRVHNSGHWTIEGAVTSQFENHLRAILGLPLGDTYVLGHAAMVNIIGNTHDLKEILSVPGAHLHLYDKKPAPGRKLGHVNLLEVSDKPTLETRLLQVQKVLDSDPIGETP